MLHFRFWRSLNLSPCKNSPLHSFLYDEPSITLQAADVVIHFLCNSRQFGTCCLAKDTFYSTTALPVFVFLWAVHTLLPTPFTQSLLRSCFRIALQLGLWLVKITGGTLRKSYSQLWAKAWFWSRFPYSTAMEPYLEGIVNLDKFFTMLTLSAIITLVCLYALLCERWELC